jgi:hypothetical protein
LTYVTADSCQGVSVNKIKVRIGKYDGMTVVIIEFFRVKIEIILSLR